MSEILLLIAGAIGGFMVHSVTMKVTFKQRTIDNKIKVYDSLITQWVRMRNFVYSYIPEQSAESYPIGIIKQGAVLDNGDYLGWKSEEEQT